MKKIISLLIILITIIACGTIKPIPVETVINYKDSTVVNTIDSIVYIPRERVVDIVPQYDTLKLETNKAQAEAWVDTTLHVLRGNIENKTGIEYKYIYKDRIEYRDSIVTEQVPYPVEVEKIKYKHTFWDKLAWLISGLSISILVIYIVHKLYGTKGKLL